MRRHWQYLKYVLRHKWFVFVEGIKIGVPIHLLILHDMSKFRSSEWFAYARTFHEPNGSPQYNPDYKFNHAWLTHIHRNKHHWQYWVLNEDDGDEIYLLMPFRYGKEMLADWRGAGRALGNPDTKAWYLDNKEHIKLNPLTREWIECQLKIGEYDIGQGRVVHD
jgi:hypothetical protein